MVIFKTVRRLCEALECLTSATEALRESVVVARDWSAEQGNVEARVEELERQRHLFQAEIHGELLKAQAEYRKADNAEKRAKTAAGRNDGLGDGAEESADEFAERYRAWIQSGDADAGAPIEVPPLFENLAIETSIVEALKANKRSR